MKLIFNKIQNQWFLDNPQYIEEGGSMADLQMVAGADIFLDQLSKRTECHYLRNAEGGVVVKENLYYNEKVVMEISLSPNIKFSTLIKVKEDENGAWYLYPKNDHLMWLCPVTYWLFKKYPDYIYFKNLENE